MRTLSDTSNKIDALEDAIDLDVASLKGGPAGSSALASFMGEVDRGRAGLRQLTEQIVATGVDKENELQRLNDEETECYES